MANENGRSQLLSGLLDPYRPAPTFTNLHPSFFKVASFLSIYLGFGTLCFYALQSHIEGLKTNGLVDSLYFCVVTMTTVGYGDLVPSSVLSKLLACAFVFLGVAMIVLILSKAAEYLVEKQETLLVRSFRMRHKLAPSDAMREIEISRVKHKCFIIAAVVLVLMAVGTIVMVFVEEKSVVNAFYCVCCTITTLGYGDQSFLTEGGRIFAVFWIPTSTVCLGQFFLYAAELHTERKRGELVRLVLGRRVTYRDLEEADLNNDGVVEAGEFVLFKLKEMGKINQRDISMLLREFEELDIDRSGTISVSDIIAVAQLDARRRIASDIR